MQIKIKNLKQIFSPKTPWEFKALDNVNLEIQQGQYLGIIGQTGSGKTTFIQHLNGLLLPTDGQINWIYTKEIFDPKTKKQNIESIERSLPILKPYKCLLGSWCKLKSHKKLKKNYKFKYAKEIRKKIGVVFQFAEYQLFKQTIMDDIIFAPLAFGVSLDIAKDRAHKYIKMVGLNEEFLKRSPFDLSGGQKRRVALAGILALEPDVLIVDEPTAGLDPVGVVEILDILTELNKKGKTIINVTHELDHVLERAKRVVVFKEGAIVRDGNPYDILNDIEFLRANELQPPKLLDFVNKLRARGIDVPKVTSNQELIAFLNQMQGGK